MSSLTVVTYSSDNSRFLDAITTSRAVSRVLILGGAAGSSPIAGETVVRLDADLMSASGLYRVLETAPADYLLVVLPGQRVYPGERIVERLLASGEDSGAGLVYSDFRDEAGGVLTDHPLIDYQPGSIRDDFDFGSLFLISRKAASDAIRSHGGPDSSLRWGALYDLRLKLSIGSSILRLPEPLYTRVPVDNRATGARQFDYVDPRQRDYQLEMETVATAHLKRIGGFLAPAFAKLPDATETFPVEASVVIPVRNREKTIGDAVKSALSQKTSFNFNVIAVDNHSTDNTTRILETASRENQNLVHLIPERTDLGIGGCWNQAIYSMHCGRIAVQLDSDDLYRDPLALEQIVSKFNEGSYAMVIGSYAIVDFELREIPPGLIDHREWTRENGRNNALRINGLGAPRAFYVPVLRRFGFPNVSYGEDYAVGLRISREYEIGRIYEPVYYARRWEGNSDAQLDRATANRYDAYKDRLRTVEIMARKRLNER